MKKGDRESVTRQVSKAPIVGLFLDYDGTLAEFSPTPAIVEPNAQVIALITSLAKTEGVLLAVISGRRLAQVEALIPVENILLAGTYGLETRLPDGSHVSTINLDQVRPIVEQVKVAWEKFVQNTAGFYLEDKGWSVALHGRFAAQADADRVFRAAKNVEGLRQRDQGFHLLEGERFLEYAPLAASKGLTVKRVLSQWMAGGAYPVIIGDDERDEEAFLVVQDAGGIAIKVGNPGRDTNANFRLQDPAEVNQWLSEVLHAREE